jgi:6-phosphogluconolactonase
MRPEVRRYPNFENLSRAAAGFVCELAEKAVKKKGFFSFVLSGGKTPRLLYEILAKKDFSERMPWQQTHIFWGDERVVPPDHPDSNYAMAFDTLISKVPLPPENVHRIPTEKHPPDTIATVYENALRGFFQNTGRGEEISTLPAFDLILLGVGQDGHTASLFPGDLALEERSRWVVAVSGSKASPPVPRITLTYPIINRARCVLFLTSVSGKKEVLEAILDGQVPEDQPYPAARVKPLGSLLWFIDDGLA